MRPHRIRLSAFGPYPGVVEVDLDRLGAGGLFLLHGPTGAGKTTLLDGMCFALYGRVPRAMRTFRSDHAGPDAQCSVELELSVGGRRLRVTRTPGYDRPKKRGPGTVKEQPTARLEQLRGGTWTTTSTRLDEVGAELEQLLGMTAEQFWQVVLLPQGRFADFLRADAAQREKLLEALFRSDRFRDAEQWLADRRRAVAARFDAAATEARRLAALVADAAGADEPDEPTTPWYDGVLAAAADLDVAAAAEVVAGDAAVARTQQALRAAEDLADRQRRLGRATSELAALEAGAATVADLRAVLDSARLAAPLLPLVERADAAATTAATTAAAVATDGAGRAATLGLGVAELRAAAEAQRARTGRLEALADQAARLADVEQRAAHARQRGSEIDAELADVLARQHRVPLLRLDAETALSAARAAAGRLPTARARVERATALVAADRRRADLRAELAQATAADTDAREAAVAARERAADVRHALLAGQAARLAAELRDGEPCAVCGSEVHPDPADAGDLVEEVALTAADDAVDAAQAVRAGTGKRVALVAAELARLDDELAGWVDDLAEAVDALASLTAAADAEAEADDAVRGLAELDLGLGRREAALTAERVQVASAAADADLAATVARAVLTDALEGAADLPAALAAATAAADGFDAAAEARAAADRAATDLADARASLAAALARTALADGDAVRAAAAVDVPTVEAQLRAYDDRVAAVRTQLADPDLDVPLEPDADPTTAGAEHDAAVRARRTAGDVAALAADVHRRVAGHGPALRAAVTALEPLRAERDVVAGLAEVTGGRNPLGMTLSTYVLAARLEEVAVAASRRLTLMTDGRYTLRHSDERRDGRRRSGLGLVVRDAWTGRDRDTGTLSGGETFVASLALALGLADTVTAEAGGAPIEALFVDEGFGTLDEDTLDEVMDVLDGLRAGGRVVGLVSHVAELRQRIPAQLRVHKHHDGSTLEIVA